MLRYFKYIFKSSGCKNQVFPNVLGTSNYLPLTLLFILTTCASAQAATTEDQRRGDLNNRHLPAIVLEAGVQGQDGSTLVGWFFLGPLSLAY